MRFIAVDWGTSRCRAALVEAGTILDRAESADGIASLRAGQHRAIFDRLCGAWLAAEPALPVVMAGMVGSREGWVEVPYVACPAGPAEIARAAVSVELGDGRLGLVVPGLRCEREGGGVDVMRGEETHLLGTGIADGLVCLPGTHCKWAEIAGGRIRRFATFMTGEMHGLLLAHSMIGRPASAPVDEAGFAAGLAAAAAPEGTHGGLLDLLFGARAATVTGRLPPARLGPYLSGLLTGTEVRGALALFGPRSEIAVVSDEPRAGLYVEALGRHGVAVRPLRPATTLLAGLGRVVAARSSE